ncbi:uncharacterized protein LOC119110293 isoform X1 [Pollicipes pollicipes]|uniref:uncharacterized protein LOC119110293 isoform X1 n=1 Tax=Pollicipes pollicipes TaxID=41117 RepID=UPI001885504C|nr:uncharacterized protein LOC119110293 isoform X1 [Pollicipes pollicipes]
MADTNEAEWAQAEKKKKKKSKKKEAEAAAPAPDQEPADPMQEQEREWPPQVIDEPDPELVQDEEAPLNEALVNGEAPPLGDGLDEPPQQIEKRKSPYPVFWNRPKARMYRMNFDYGETYYSNMMAYLNSKSGSIYRNNMPPPKAQSWAERAHKSATLRYPRQEADLSAMLQSVRSNIRNYDMHHRQYTSKVQSVYGGSKAL